ncbi:MAG: four helix bundle protein [Patescibacteria group bacterium]|nr:four helix bundle protein [Patescibacteria group bacterium]
MDQVQNKIYDLGERTLKFSKDVRLFVRELPRTVGNIEDGKQVIRSSGSVGANYIEACECLSKKDFLMRVKICRKEAKETIYWLNLVYCEDRQLKERDRLIQECTELMKIFGSIVSKA